MVDASTSQSSLENESSSFISLDAATKLIIDFDGSKRELHPGATVRYVTRPQNVVVEEYVDNDPEFDIERSSTQRPTSKITGRRTSRIAGQTNNDCEKADNRWRQQRRWRRLATGNGGSRHHKDYVVVMKCTSFLSTRCANSTHKRRIVIRSTQSTPVL
ncbi:hypothetical protein CBL_20503 [Carabus blaptoides fortunei]